MLFPPLTEVQPIRGLDPVEQVIEGNVLVEIE
jgi:hypothetical protein